MLGRLLAGVLCAFAFVATARADAFLLKGGGRVFGTVESEYKDEYKRKWLRVRTAFGLISFRKSELKKKLPQKGQRDTLYLEEMRVLHVAGDVRRSSDEGKTWFALRLPSKGDDTGEPEWPQLHPGDRMKTGANGKAEIDVGFGLVSVDSESELGFAASSGATLRVLRGRVGADLTPPAGQRKFRVETPQASMGVRGTLFFVHVEERTRVGVVEGLVDMSGSLVEADRALNVTGTAPAEPDTLSDDERDFLERVDAAIPFPRVDWVVLPPGRFEMGGVGGALAATPVHEVSLPGLLMSRTEVTWEQYDAFLAWTARHASSTVLHRAFDRLAPPAAEGREYEPLSSTASRTDAQQPACVPWGDAWAFALWLGARLPSEAEWEYAARAGTDTPFYWGDDEREVVEHEWVLYNAGDMAVPWRTEWGPGDPNLQNVEYGKSSGVRPRPVGTKSANRFGLHDMLGNMREWCEDTPHDGYDGAPTDGSAWVSPPYGGDRVTRGADFNMHDSLQVFLRSSWPASRPHGFRLARNALREER